MLVDGVPVRTIRWRACAPHIGVVPQKAVLFHGTIRENLLWGKADATDEELSVRRSAPRRRRRSCRATRGRPGRVETGRPQFFRRSAPEAYHCACPRQKPEILILDDSASALDFATDAALRKALRALPWHPAHGVIISQRTSSIRHADQKSGAGRRASCRQGHARRAAGNLRGLSRDL